jgi:hypothetical protein
MTNGTGYGKETKLSGNRTSGWILHTQGEI